LEALQYHHCLSMADEEVEFIERVFDEVDDGGEAMEDQTEPVKLPVDIQSSGA
jgi:hypothetical protein